MRTLSLSLALLVLLMTAPAMAGQVSYNDGKGVWTPTGCTAPQQPATLDTPSNIRASDLNARIVSHNAFVPAAEAYMDCVSKEAQRDSESMSQLIIGSAQAIIDRTQADAKISASLVRNKKGQN